MNGNNSQDNRPRPQGNRPRGDYSANSGPRRGNQTQGYGSQQGHGSRQNGQRKGSGGQRRPSPEEIRRREQARREAERRKAYEKELRRRKRKQDTKIFMGRFVVFIAVLVILLIIAGVLFWVYFNNSPHADPDSGKITYYYGGTETRSADIKSCVINGTPFICFNDLSDYLNMAESGGADGLKFLFRAENGASDSGGDGTEEYVIFPTGSREAIINGQRIGTDGTNRIVGDEVWVSTDFISDYMLNISVVYDSKKQTITVAKIKDEEKSTKEETVYLPVAFRLKSEKAIDPVPNENNGVTVLVNPSGSGENPTEVYELNFANDLSDYEKYMNPEDRDAYLTLVNKVTLLDESYTPSDLVDCKYTAQGRSTMQLRLYANKALEALMLEMQSAGYYNMAVYSAFRSYSYQNMLFNQYTLNEMAANTTLTREQAEEIVLTYSMRPGSSEHQTGLAVDMDTMGTFSTDFQYTNEYKWLSENAWKFGFVLRFPDDKTDITKIQFEPWHYRFVGRYHAKKMHDSGVCLEEYVESLNNQ